LRGGHVSARVSGCFAPSFSHSNDVNNGRPRSVAFAGEKKRYGVRRAGETTNFRFLPNSLLLLLDIIPHMASPNQYFFQSSRKKLF
jgi:hypothetical protein